MKNYIIGAILALAIIIGSIVSLKGCNRDSGASIAKVDTILQVRHDTIIKMDSALKIKVHYIDTSKVQVVHDTLNAMIKDTTHDTVIISSNQLRECVKCKDSLEVCSKILSIDSATIDSLASIAKKKPSQSLDYKGYGVAVGAGLLLGIILSR